jgi:hypothetical protein
MKFHDISMFFNKNFITLLAFFDLIMYNKNIITKIKGKIYLFHERFNEQN